MHKYIVRFETISKMNGNKSTWIFPTTAHNARAAKKEFTTLIPELRLNVTKILSSRKYRG